MTSDDVQFYERALADGPPLKIGEYGTIRLYDPATNTFGSYAPDGTILSFQVDESHVLGQTAGGLSMDSETHTCPSCGFTGLEEPPRRSSSSGGSYEICPSCGFEFGVTDDDRGFSYEAWRARWIARGMPWETPNAGPPPDGWDPRTQLESLSGTEADAP